MPPPMTKNACDGLSYLIKVVTKQTAEKCMPDVAIRVDGDSGDEMLDVGVGDVGVSVDDRWKRKGFSSTLGVVTASSVDNGKVLDVAIISKSCKCCTSTKKLPLLIPFVMRHRSCS